jgi:lysophospholipase L1-like esterase
MSLATILAAVVDGFAGAFRNYETDGVPASGVHKVTKAEARGLASTITGGLQYLNDTFVGTFSGVGSVYDTKAHLDADLVPAANVVARVIADGTPANNGYYKKSGATGTGSWSFLGADPAVAANEDAQDAAATAVAAKDAILSAPLIPRCVFFGDSIMQANHSPLDPAMSTAAVGEIVQAHALYPYFEIDSWLDLPDDHDIGGCNQGQSGWRADEISANFAIGKMAADFYIVSAGINDIGQGQSGVSTAADIQAACEQLAITGRPIIVTNLRSLTDSSKHAAFVACNDALDAWWATDPPGIIPVDLRSIYSTSSSDPTPVSGLTSDGTHPYPKGAQKAAPLFVAAIKQVVKSQLEAKPLGTNLRPNPTFTGTGGALAGGVTGTMATGWTLTKALGTATVVGAQSSGHQIATVTHATSGIATELVYASADTGFSTPIEDGKWYKGWAKVRLSGWAGFKSVRLGLGALGDALYTDGAHDGYPTTDPLTLLVVSAPVLCDADVGLNPTVYVFLDGTVAGSGVLTFLECGVAEVPDPRPLHGFET